MRTRLFSVTVSTGLALALPTSTAAIPAGGSPKLPPETLRGPAHRLHQYPTVALASPAQRAAAVRLLEEVKSATHAWRTRRDALSAGFGQRLRPRRRAGDRSILYFHAPNRRFAADARHLDGSAPETLIYADAVGRPLVLIGVMFAVPRGVHGPTPGGPITRWHTHGVCIRGNQRGVSPRRDGSCPPGTTFRQGSEMLHLWFTRDLRSAYAIHAPEPELCGARLLPRQHCHRIGHDHG